MMSNTITRRALVAGAVSAGALLVCTGWTKSRLLPFGSDTKSMQPGDYTWAPDRSPDGPVVIIVSIPEQRGYVYRDGQLIAVTTCSTGRSGHKTPTGVFTILQKDKDHVSSTYKGAEMPFMERLTWSGIALHAGNLPGYPASHGCIRMPLEFAHKLFGVTHLGVAVILADNASEPTDVVHPGLLLPRHADDEARVVVAKATEKALPPLHRHEAPHRPAQVLASVAERKLTILEDGHTRLSGPLTVKNPRQPVGNHMFILNEAHESGTALKWTAISYRMTPSRRAGRPAPSEASVIDRLTTDRRTADALHSVMHPGLVMVVTDAPASPRTRSSQGFVIATHHEPDGWRASTTQVR